MNCVNVIYFIIFYPKNEFDSRKFMRKLNSYTGGKFKYFIVWQTRKIESLFNRSLVRRRVLEAFYIAVIKPELNRRVKSFELRLFPKGIGIT